MPSETVFIERRRLGRAALRYVVWSSGVIVFALLATTVHGGGGPWFDRPVLAALAAIHTAERTTAMHLFTLAGSARWLAAIAIMSVAVMCARRHWRSALYLALASAGAATLNHGLKHLFARARPDLALMVADGFAFPSGHSMGSAAVYGAIAVTIAARYPRLRVPLVALCATLVALIGVSRAYLGVHYPSDVIAGWALGASWPLWLKPLILGPGFHADAIPERELEADNFAPERVVAEERSTLP